MMVVASLEKVSSLMSSSEYFSNLKKNGLNLVTNVVVYQSLIMCVLSQWAMKYV